MVAGRFRPLIENCAEPTANEDTVTEVFPALRVPVWLWVVPAATLPKLMVEGVTVN